MKTFEATKVKDAFRYMQQGSHMGKIVLTMPEDPAELSTVSSAKKLAFQDTCYTIFEKLIHTVPSSVMLSDIVGPRQWTMAESELNLASGGEVYFSGSITWWSNTESPPSTAPYTYTAADGSAVESLNTGVGGEYPSYGDHFVKYPF